MVAALIVCALLGAGGAQAQVFSPGPLANVHRDLEGVTSCTKCHEEAGRHADSKCLACHEEIKKSSYHKSSAVKGEANCASCHREHRGVATPLIEWKPSKRAFNHSLTKWPLEGSHKKTECTKCHDEKKKTYIGLPTECVKCHVDEHRGQEGDNCAKCHNSEKFTKAPFFNHNKSEFASFPLTGRHRDVACIKCHAKLTDDRPDDDGYLQYQDVPTTCVGCHDDVHRGEFGKNCVRCHVTDGWKNIKASAQDTGFHDKTDFPLKGEHQSVDCRTCHGSGRSAVFKNLPHAKCADCHIDAHAGQVPPEDGAVRCERCHNVNGFVPVLFDAKLHDATRFPLDGSHEAVACNLCHKRDGRLLKKVPAAVKRNLDKRDRRLLISDVKLDLAEATERCETCHTDPHAGQFDARVKEKGCNSCHAATSFTAITFDHDKDSRFPLSGKHAKVSCGGCHAPAGKGKKDVVVYRPLDIACGTCHADPHLGQLGVTPGATAAACATCHQTSGFKPPLFDHDKQSSFKLEGKHEKVRCTSCHPMVDVGEGVKAARYKPLPSSCGSCHIDEHKGTFDKLIPTSTERALATGDARCAACHTMDGWSPGKIAHERTGFALKGKHTGVNCADCHGADTARAIPTSCAGCHQDPHAQEFGTSCRSCHDESGFQAPRFAVDAHRRTNFPLVGRHAGIPCEECHIEKREITFTRGARDCASCHARDALRATLVTVDHARAPFSTSCRGCHEPVSFTPARFPGHEACFPLQRGSHVKVSCTECHANLRGARADGACAGVPVRCAECHIHAADVEERNHRDVPGYEHASERCASCHRTSR